MTDRAHLTLREARRQYILSILDRTGWDVRKASALLKVSERFLKGEIRKMGAEHRKENDKK